MFHLELAWDRPAKISSQPTNHVLRVRILPQNNGQSPGLPLHIALALDVSSSMQGEKLHQAKAAVQAVVSQLRDRDRLSLASFATRVTPLLQQVTGTAPSTTTAIQDLKAEGVTRTDLALDWINSALPRESGVARVGILITDGHPTNHQGQILDTVTALTDQAAQLAAAGITLCTVGLGNAANFNTAFLVDLGDRGRGAFLYADTPATLEPALRERLITCQAISLDHVQLKLEPANGVKVQGFCRFRPEYLPLEETAPHQLALGVLQANTPTDVLLELAIPPLGFGESAANQAVIQVQLVAPNTPAVTAQATIHNTQSFRESQEVNQEVNDDRLFWEINLSSTELTRTTDPKRTGELLGNIQVAAMKTGQTAIANQAAQQLDDLKKTGTLNRDKTTKLLQTSRNLGGA